VANLLNSETANLERIAALIWPNESRILIRAESPSSGRIMSGVEVMRLGNQTRGRNGLAKVPAAAAPFHDP
jgi:hypothetical protein